MTAQDLERMWAQFEENREAEQQAKAERDQKRRKAEEAQRKAEELEAAAAQDRKEARAASWDPRVDPGTVSAAEKRATGKEARARQFRKEAEEAEEEWREAKLQTRQSARTLGRALAARLTEEQLPARERALETLADAVLAALPAVEEAEEAVTEGLEELRGLKPYMSGDQRQHLDHYLRDHADASARARLGAVLLDLLRWIQRVDAFAEVLKEAGIEPTEGSPRHRDPVPAVEDTLARIESGKLPARIEL